ncbi:MAG: DUF1572 family protein [Flavisolibacter sp.]|nr:DUF1572 family protein [Flavisolibacter sp.]
MAAENLTDREFLNESRNRMESSFQRLYHCLGQLNEKQIWWQPNDKMNSVGTLITHICGSFRQWTITNINNEEDLRDRPREFLNDDKITKAELMSLTEKLRSDFISSITNLNPSRLMEQRRIQGFEVTLMSAIFRALTHLEGHIGQIILLTRLQLGDGYKIFWMPQTDEQKAERKSSTHIS